MNFKWAAMSFMVIMSVNTKYDNKRRTIQIWLYEMKRPPVKYVLVLNYTYCIKIDNVYWAIVFV